MVGGGRGWIRRAFTLAPPGREARLNRMVDRMAAGGRQLRRGRARAGDDRRPHDVDRADHPRRPVRRAAGRRRLLLRPHPTGGRDDRGGHRRHRHRVRRLPDGDDRVDDLGDRLPADREQRHPAADPAARASTSTRSPCSSRCCSAARCSASPARCSPSPSPPRCRSRSTSGGASPRRAAGAALERRPPPRPGRRRAAASVSGAALGAAAQAVEHPVEDAVAQAVADAAAQQEAELAARVDLEGEGDAAAAGPGARRCRRRRRRP